MKKIKHKLVLCLKLFYFFVENTKFLGVRLMCLKNRETLLAAICVGWRTLPKSLCRISLSFSET